MAYQIYSLMPHTVFPYETTRFVALFHYLPVVSKVISTGEQVYELLESENGEVYIYRRTPKDCNSKEIELFALTRSLLKHYLLVKGEYILKLILSVDES